MHPQKERKSLHALFSSAENYGNETFSYKLLFSAQEKKKIFSQKYNSKKVFRLHENSFPKCNHIFVKR